MPSPLDESIRLLAAEEEHLNAVNDCFVYFSALAETRHRGYASVLFECLPKDLPRDCDDETALRIHTAIVDFVEKCPQHPIVQYSFHILLFLNKSDDLRTYLINKLKQYYAWGDAGTVFQICSVLEDAGVGIFSDEHGQFIQSRSCIEAEKNLGVARRFLERLKTQTLS